ncbi:MAG TPA: hypothetical protein VK824_04070 [Planctomycetota bacterium]|nr:hypothetical protein [Planctomycetota bacterium]
MASFSVRPYEPGDEEGLLALFNRVFSEGNPAFVPRTMETWRGIFLDNPAGMQTFVGLDAERQVVANYSSIPAAAVVRGERRMCTQAVDSCVDRAWRGSLRKQSLFVTIATEFIRHFGTEGQPSFDDFMYGMPNEQAFPIGTRIIGYKPVLVPLHALVHELLPASAAWHAALRAEGEAGGVRVDEFSGADVGEAAALFERHLAESPLGIWRDAPYLSWRYRPRPDVQYRALLARRGGQLAGLVVFRMGWMGQPLVPLVDWIGPGADRAALAALLGHVARLAQEAGARRLETWITPHTAHHATLAALGLADEPTRFNLCIMTFGPRVDLEWAKANWFLTMGDTDIF